MRSALGRRWAGTVRIGIVLGFAATPVTACAAPPLSAPGEDVTFDALPGFAHDDLRPAFRAFVASCGATVAGRAVLPPPPDLTTACRVALALRRPGTTALRRFFRRHFTPRRVSSTAFFTGYYEPAVPGSLKATPAFPTPLYARPSDLVSVTPGTVPGLDPLLSAARRRPDGTLSAVPDRAEIEAGAFGASARPLIYVASPLDAFFIQVQGSARIRLPNGALRRLVFAGRNGYPYTSIGKILVGRLHVPPSAMGMAQLRAWIKEHGQGKGDEGTRLMQENRSFIFFRFDDRLLPGAGPIGAQGVSLTPLRSLAIDRTLWPYGLPFYVDAMRADGKPLRRLMVGQDTGAAIIGRARADIFFGTGEAAARAAGATRQSGTLFVLWPRPATDRLGRWTKRQRP